MKLLWEIEDKDVLKIKGFFERHSANAMVVERRKRNVGGDRQPFSRPVFWKEVVVCLLTTQQRSGPGSPVSRFAGQERFLLSYEECTRRQGRDLEGFASRALTDFGGIRRGPTIAKEIDRNFRWLEEEGGWEKVGEVVARISQNPTPQAEAEAADFVGRRLKGFGPKQSRNLLQGLGLTKYEIPIDSRIVKRLNEFGFPVELSAGALSDLSYYKFVSEGVRKLCEACDIYPCLLDAALFSSFDAG